MVKDLPAVTERRSPHLLASPARASFLALDCPLPPTVVVQLEFLPDGR